MALPASATGRNNSSVKSVEIVSVTAVFAVRAILFVGVAPVGAGFPSDRFANANALYDEIAEAGAILRSGIRNSCFSSGVM